MAQALRCPHVATAREEQPTKAERELLVELRRTTQAVRGVNTRLTMVIVLAIVILIIVVIVLARIAPLVGRFQ